MQELRPYQTTAIEGLRHSLTTGHRRPVLQAPTGSGKTLVASAVVERALRKSKRTTFVVPALSLIDQAVEMFYNEGITEVGVIQAQHRMTDWAKPVQIASVQTLARRRERPKSDMVIVDECHRWFEFIGKWMAEPSFAKVPFIGLSATPWTKGLGKRYDDLIIATTTQELIAQGYLSPFRVYGPSHPDLSEVRTVAGDYHEGDLSEAMDKPQLVADVVATWLQHAGDQPTFVFAVDCAHAQHLAARFTEAGVSTGYIDAFTDSYERKRIRNAFHAGSIKVVCNVGCLTTGVDWDVRCIVLARPTKSEMLFVQMIGRGLRTAPGKDHCLILDHSDTHERLGFVTDIEHPALDNGREKVPQKAEKAERLPKPCPQCTFLRPVGLTKCPICGFEAKIVSRVVAADGELEEKRAPKRELTFDQKRSFYGQLAWIARRRGYSVGWIANQFRKRTGVWPNHHKDAPEISPSQQTLNWVKGQQIAYAKSLEAKRRRELTALPPPVM